MLLRGRPPSPRSFCRCNLHSFVLCQAKNCFPIFKKKKSNKLAMIIWKREVRSLGALNTRYKFLIVLIVMTQPTFLTDIWLRDLF